MTVLSNIITPSNVLTTTNTATVTNKTLTSPTVTGMVVSDGTANGVTYLNGSKILSSGSALVFDGTNLGIGTTPASILHLKGADPIQYFEDSSGTSSACSIQNSNGVLDLQADNNATVASSAIKFSVDSAEGMRLTSTGLGIGTSSGTAKLSVKPTANTYTGGALALVGASSGTSYITSIGGQLFVSNDGSTDHLVLSSAGNLGLGVTPSAWLSSFRALQIGQGSSLWGAATGNNAAFDSNVYVNSSGSSIYIGSTFATRYQQNDGAHKWSTAASGTAGNAITFTAAMTLDASGQLAIGNTSPAAKLEVYQVGSGASVLPFYAHRSNAGIVARFVNEGYGSSLDITATASNNILLQAASGDALSFSANGNATSDMVIDTSGNLLVGKSAATFATAGSYMSYTGKGVFTVNADEVMLLNRLTDDGNLMRFYQASTEEGNISVSGTTVSYNGGHLSRWAQTTTAKDESLVKGTVLSNLDAMNVYTKDGQPVDNEQLNKVKVSDTEGDANVAGVFVNWSHDDDHNVDEINMAMTGDMIIRIAQGITVVRGDLLMSAGDGTAKPQGDDIVRSKTVAKVTSNHITCTYADGSYCVPCVLMAC
jgi:hypothetical protein